MTIPAGAERSFAGDVVEQLAERLAERHAFSEVVRTEVAASAGRICALAADLNGANDLPPQEDFELFVLAERTVQLASPKSCAYTDFAAVSHRSSRVIQRDPAGTCAAERACLRRQPSLMRVISSESCILLPASFPLGHFWRSISGPIVPHLSARRSTTRLRKSCRPFRSA